MISVKISGVPELQAALTRLRESEQKKVLRNGLKKAGEVVLSAIKENVPVDTGELKSELNVKATVGSRKALAKITTGKARHGHLVELGVPSRGSPPRPFMRSGLYDTRPAARAAFIQELGDSIKAVGFKNAQIQQKREAKRIRKFNRLKGRILKRAKKIAKGAKRVAKKVRG